MEHKNYIFSSFFLFLFSFLSTEIRSEDLNALSLDSIIECYNSKEDGQWKYLEYLFITQPSNKIHVLTTHAQGIMMGCGALFLMKDYIISAYSKNNTAVNSNIDIQGSIAAILAGNVAYNAYLCHNKGVIQKETLITFINNWEAHRLHIPESFISCFDELANQYQAMGSIIFTDKKIGQIFEVVQHLIEHYFNKRYKKDTPKDIEVLGTLKTITDICKNFK